MEGRQAILRGDIVWKWETHKKRLRVKNEAKKAKGGGFAEDVRKNNFFPAGEMTLGKGKGKDEFWQFDPSPFFFLFCVTYQSARSVCCFFL